MRVVIYCRYSSELQNPKSCDDQEREIRAGLVRLGVDATTAEVIHDAAVSGTKTDREGFDEIRQRIRRGEKFILAVDDQSRFSRLDNTFALVTDLVYAGGRFISTCEHVDTDVPGWKLKVRVMELHHSTCSDEGGNRVRRGQRGRVLEGMSAGDFPFGYESYPIDPEYAKNYCGRGPKPAMGLRISWRLAQWVVWMFEQFVAGRSINWIAREMNRLNVARDRRAKSSKWYAPTIRLMLSNAKYIGQWSWGRTTTVRDSSGRKKPVPVSSDEVVTVERPSLRILTQDLWEKAQKRLRELRQATGWKPGQASRLPIVPHSIMYPTDMLMTLLVCGYCGGKMHYAGSGKHIYRECVNSIDGIDTCKARVRVPAAKARAVLLEFVGTLLLSMPNWIATAVDAMRTAIEEIQSRVPEEVRQLREQLHEAEQRRDNLLRIAESGGMDDVETFKQRLRKAEEEAMKLRSEVERLERLASAQLAMPDDAWIKARLREIATTLASDEAATARLLRELIGNVRVFRVIPIGKKFGYQQLRFKVSGWRVVREALLGQVPPEILEIIVRHQQGDGDQSPEFVLDVGGPTNLDTLAPRIAELRATGMKWADIGSENGISGDSAHKCWRRYIDALAASEPAPSEDGPPESPNDGHGEDDDVGNGRGAA